jgi:hypothetical protein
VFFAFAFASSSFFLSFLFYFIIFFKGENVKEVFLKFFLPNKSYLPSVGFLFIDKHNSLQDGNY